MREFLKGLELDDETIDTIMSEYGKLVTRDKEKITELTQQIKDANDEIKSYKDMDIDSIKKSAEDWKTKYEEMEANQKAEKEKSIREERTNAFFNDVKFASNASKEGIIAEFNKKNFKYDEEAQKFQGASEWLEELKKNDAGAFISEVANPKFSTNPTAPHNDSSIDELKEAMGLSNEKK
mgnify:CR=1 FL=1